MAQQPKADSINSGGAKLLRDFTQKRRAAESYHPRPGFNYKPQSLFRGERVAVAIPCPC
jgi:hypothetical protein